MQVQKKKRIRTKNITPETRAVRLMRELRNLPRSTAAIIVEFSPDMLEKIENGYVKLTPELINHFIRAYGFSQNKFHLLLEGKTDQVRRDLEPPNPKDRSQTYIRRNYKKLITKDVKTLKVLRKLKGLTQAEANRLCGYCRTSINHIENGRVELPRARIAHIVKSYGYTMEDFAYHKNSDQFVTDIQEDCIKIIQALDETKIKAVYPLLKTFDTKSA